VPSEKGAARSGIKDDAGRMIAARFARGLQRSPPRLDMHFLSVFQRVRSIRKTCNQLIDSHAEEFITFVQCPETAVRIGSDAKGACHGRIILDRRRMSTALLGLPSLKRPVQRRRRNIIGFSQVHNDGLRVLHRSHGSFQLHAGQLELPSTFSASRSRGC